MRLVLVILVGLCVWLLAERHRLSTNVGNLESQTATLNREKAELEKRLAAIRLPEAEKKKNWLQERIQESSNLLDGRQRGSTIR